MTSYNEGDAVRYNDARPYSETDWLLIQVTVGSELDGIPGPETARAVRDWQGDHGLGADGKVGPETYAAIMGDVGDDVIAPPPPRVVPVGVWWDHTAGLSVADTAALLARVGVSAVCVMLDDVPEQPYPPTPTWDKGLGLEKLREIRDACREHNIRTEAACWPVPRAAHITALAAQIGERMAALGATHLQLDVEGNWEEADVLDYDSLSDAATALVSALRASFGDGLELATTSFPFHAEYGANPSLAALVPRKIPQAYSRYNKGAADYRVGGKYGPGQMQTLAASRARSVMPCELEMGVALWDQTGLYPTPEQAILEACAAAARAGAGHLWGWSLKWIVQNDYAQRGVASYLKGETP